MQQHYRSAFAHYAIDDLRIAALDFLKKHAQSYGLVAPCAATGAVNSSGSSGITIQAIG